jgi:uncharacterized SAM-dependent methyltransferase
MQSVKPYISRQLRALIIDHTGEQFDMQHEQLRQRIRRLVEQRPHFAKDRSHDAQHGKVAVHGICGSYHDTIDYMRAGGLDQEDVRRSRNVQARKCLMWLGSSFTNLVPQEAARFLRQFSCDSIMQAGDFMLVGIDRCRDIVKVKAAYNERSRCWQDYVLNGVSTAADLTNLPGLYSSGDDWEYVARWDADQGRHVVSASHLLLSLTSRRIVTELSD